MKTIDERSSEKEIQLEMLKSIRFIANYLREKTITAQDIGLISNANLILALGISEKTLREMRNDGSLPFISFGRKIFYRVSDIHALAGKTSKGTPKQAEEDESAAAMAVMELTAANNH